MHQGELLRRWQERWPETPPIAHNLKSAYPNQWARFHSLPGSKRYPTDAAEYVVLLNRYNTILDELFSGKDIYVVTAAWSESSLPARHCRPPADWHPARARYWTSFCTSPDPDPEYATYTHLYMSQTSWERGHLDKLMHATADDIAAGVLITDTALERICHPYDGGSDVILPTTSERDQLRTQHAEWLSSSPSGL